jgi:hypothetical protein
MLSLPHGAMYTTITWRVVSHARTFNPTAFSIEEVAAKPWDGSSSKIKN